MTETITGGPGPRHAFAPHPDPIEGALYRIHVVFEESDGRLWAAGTDIMAPTLESAETFADRLNEALGLDRVAWAARATRAFAPGEAREDGADYFALSADRSHAFLIELKTDLRSVRTDQERYLEHARTRGMPDLLARVISMANAAKPYARRKYFHLLWTLDALGLIDLPSDLADKIYGPPRGVHKCIDAIRIAPVLPALETIHVLPTADDTMPRIDFQTFARVIQTRGEIGREFARHLHQWARIEAGTAQPGNASTG
ncbi:MAG: hypothetical protein OXE57_18780 [Alphaproteobacteria bacterium]|nr:hypothetical protein [Alphaproteobacteria bacterium]